jgi:hypothetical protein
MAKFIDNARRLPSIELVGASSNPLIYAGNSSSGVAIWGNGTSGSGVYGGSNSSSGVFGGSYTNYGVYGSSTFGTGVYGFTGAANGNWAGYFAGNVNVTGNCCNAGAGTYKIDDPLDPANKYLYHSAVQSPDMKNIYDGIVVLDGEGRAWVQLPDWFEALNIDYRYQLTPIGASGRDLRIAREIENNRFEIAGGQPGMKVSWQVTAIRQDAYANAHRTPVEEDKPADEKGKYLHPTEWGQPASLGVDYEEQQRMLQPMQP